MKLFLKLVFFFIICSIKPSFADQNSCRKKVSSRITACNVVFLECIEVGMCNYSTYCDVKTGRFFGIHPCERELSMSVKDSGIYYCDTKTVKFSKNRKKIIRNECN